MFCCVACNPMQYTYYDGSMGKRSVAFVVFTHTEIAYSTFLGILATCIQVELEFRGKANQGTCSTHFPPTFFYAKMLRLNSYFSKQRMFKLFIYTTDVDFV